MIAFFVGIVALIICAVITSERKYLIPTKDKESVKDNSQESKAIEEPKASVGPEVKAEPEFKNSTGLNILLYVGCFLIIAALMGYISTVDEDLIPPIVLSVTTIVLLASILIFRFVKFLKPSSYAFNISALVMFLFWIPSLKALGLDYDYATLAFFFFLTGASIISAAIFKHKALWYVPALSLIGLIIVGLAIIDYELDLNGALAVYVPIVVFMGLGIAFRYCWKAKVTWLPVQTRHVTRSFSFIYPFFGALCAITAVVNISEYPFGLTLFVILLSFYLMIDSLLAKSKTLINILRVCLEVILISLTIDICYSLATSATETLHRNIILVAILVSSLVQGIVSTILLAIKHDEESHSRERFVFAASIIGFAICALISSEASTYSSYHRDSNLLSDAILIVSQLSIIVFSLFALLFDRNPLMLIVTALGISDIALINLGSSPLLGCAILSLCAVVFSVAYIPLRKLDEKFALRASIISAMIATIFALGIGAPESISYIPILAVGLSMAIQGFLLDKSGLRIAGVYLATFGTMGAWVSIRDEFMITTIGNTHYNYKSYTYPTGVHITDILMCLIPAGAAFLLSLFDKAEQKTLKDSSVIKNYTVNFAVGFVIALFSTIVLIPGVSDDVEFFGFTISLAVLIALLIWSAVKKRIGFEIAALCAILVLVLENVGDNIWITMCVAGIGIIGIVVFVSYKNYKKLNSGQPTAVLAQAPEQANEEPKLNSESKESSEPKESSEAKPESKDKDETK